MAIKTPAELQTQYATTLPDNTNGDITPADVRQSQVDQTDSWDALKIDNTQDVAPRFNANQVQGTPINATAPTDKQILVFNNGTGEWEPKNDYKSSGILTLVDNAVATVITTVNTPVKVDPAAFTAANLVDFSQSTNARLTYDGTPTKIFMVNVSVSFFAATNNRLTTIYIAKNGSIINSTKASNITVSPSQTETSTFTLMSLATTDFIEIFVENNDNDNDITCVHTRLMVSTL